MIKSFKDKEAEKIFYSKISKKIPKNLLQRVLNKMWSLDAATNINELRNPPSNHLEKLSGDRENQYSVRINKKWRICFYWLENNVYNVEITDYHT